MVTMVVAAALVCGLATPSIALRPYQEPAIVIGPLWGATLTALLWIIYIGIAYHIARKRCLTEP
jgi:hypothetical protein